MQRVRARKPLALPRRCHRHALRLVHPLPLASGAAVGATPGRCARALRYRRGGWSRLQHSTVRRYTTLSTCSALAWCLRLLGVGLAAPGGSTLPWGGGQATGRRSCCLGCLSEPPPESPSPLRLTVQAPRQRHVPSCRATGAHCSCSPCSPASPSMRWPRCSAKASRDSPSRDGKLRP